MKKRIYNTKLTSEVGDSIVTFINKKEGKKWFKSKTIIVNVITLVLYLCLLFNFNEKAAEKYITVVLPMVNIVLRLVTKDPVNYP